MPRLPGSWPPRGSNPRSRSPARCSHSGVQGGHDREIRGWLDTALSLADDTTSTETRARALLASSRGALLASLRSALVDPEQAERDAAAALELYRQLGDQAGVAESHVSLGYRQVCLGRYRQAGALAQEALAAARASRDDRAIGSALWLRATAGEGFDEVRSLAREAVAHFHQSGATRRIYPLLNTAAFAAIEYGRYSEALPLLDEALPAARAADDGPGIAMIRGNEAIAHLMITNYEEAADALSEQLRLCRDLALDQTVEEALLCTATIAAHRAARHDAGLLAGAASTRFEKRRRIPAEELVFRRIEDQLSGGDGERSDPGERADEVVLPGPACWEVQRPLACAAGQSSGDLKQPTAQGARSADGFARQPDQAAPAQQVVGQAGDHGPGAVGVEAAGGEVRERLVFEVADRELDDGVLAMLSLDQLERLGAVGDEREVAPVGPELGLGADQAAAADDQSPPAGDRLGDLCLPVFGVVGERPPGLLGDLWRSPRGPRTAGAR